MHVKVDFGDDSHVLFCDSDRWSGFQTKHFYCGTGRLGVSRGKLVHMKIYNADNGERDQRFIVIDGEIYLKLSDLRDNLEAFKEGLIEMYGEKSNEVRVINAILISDSPEKFNYALRS